MSQQNENISYSPMSLAHHSSEEVAGLIGESAPELFALMFGSRAIALLTEFIRRSHKRFSHRYIRVAEIGDRVVGIVTLVPAANVNDDADDDEILNPVQKLWLGLLQFLLLRFVLQHDFPAGTFYVGNLAVASEYRNQGIGRELLLQCIAEVERIAAAERISSAETQSFTQSSTLFISVDINNGRAQKLYESLGFQVVGEKTIRFFGKAIGSRILSLSV
jgi:ribosomal protein S18 acetylase RimI-like enzyme